MDSIVAKYEHSKSTRQFEAFTEKTEKSNSPGFIYIPKLTLGQIVPKGEVPDEIQVIVSIKGGTK